jgi:translation initiation factor IF-1
MVKNTTGGNREKRNARKDIVFRDNRSYKAVRKPADPLELIAIVTKRYGGKHLGVVATDENNYQATIPGAMMGRRRRGNEIREGSILLIGLWDGFSAGKSTVLEVYDDNEVAELMRIPGMKISFLKSKVDTGLPADSHTDYVDFYDGAGEPEMVLPQNVPTEDINETTDTNSSWLDDI